MKWGVRRFQNEDGTRTAAGKRREKSADRETFETLKRERRDTLTNEELKKTNERRRLEVEYDRLNPNAVDKGRVALKTVLSMTAAITTLYVFAKSDAGQAILNRGRDVVRQMSGNSTRAIIRRMNNNF